MRGKLTIDNSPQKTYESSVGQLQYRGLLLVILGVLLPLESRLWHWTSILK